MGGYTDFACFSPLKVSKALSIASSIKLFVECNDVAMMDVHYYVAS